MKTGDKLYCIKNYDNYFKEGKYYTIDHCDNVDDGCAVSVTCIGTNITSHIYFSRFNNKICEHRRPSEDEWKLDRCQLSLNYWSKYSDEEKEEWGEAVVTSCIGSAVCIYDYFITVPEVRQQKLNEIQQNNESR